MRPTSFSITYPCTMTPGGSARHWRQMPDIPITQTGTGCQSRRAGSPQIPTQDLSGRKEFPFTPSYPHGLFSDHDELVQAVRVAVQDLLHACDPGFQFHGRQSKVNDAGVRTTAPKDKLAEIAVLGDEDALLLLGDGKHPLTS